jgi:hypothetical protein
MPNVDCEPRLLRATCNSGLEALSMPQLGPLMSPFITPRRAVLLDNKAQGVDGGSFVSGAWRTRDLNTIQDDPFGIIVALSGNQVTLAAGSYSFNGVASGRAVNRHMTRLQNITGATTITSGQNAFSSSSSTVSVVIAEASFDTTTIIELQHQCSQTVNIIGFGEAVNFAGVLELYSCLVIVAGAPA